MVTKNTYVKIILPIITATILVAFIVMAGKAQLSGVTAILPANGTNHSGNTVINVSFNNATFNVAGSSVTAGMVNTSIVYMNISNGAWLAVGNITTCFVAAPSAGASCSGTINLSQWLLNASGSINIKDGYYTLNATLFNGSATDQPKNGMGNRTDGISIMIDNTEPSNASAIWAFTNGNNHSTKVLGGNLVLNTSAIDALANVSTVRFTIRREGATGNSTAITATKEGTTVFWSVGINTSHFTDAIYNISVEVTDTAGNFNHSANTTGTTYVTSRKKIAFDNTGPVTTPTCSNIVEGAAFPCSCSFSDAVSGVNASSSSSTSPDNLGVAVNTGSFTFTCSATDRAGNSNSGSTTYTVSSEGTAGTGSSGSSGSSGSGSTGSGSGEPGTTAGTTGSGAGTGTGSSGQGTGASGSEGEEGSNTALIISIIVVLVVIAAVTVLMKKRRGQ